MPTRRLVLALCVALGCKRPRAPVDAGPVAADAPSLAVAVPGDDAGTPPDVVVRDAAAEDVLEAPLRRDGPWRRMAVVSVPARDVIERWTDGPDLDGDTFPDELVAARWSVDTQCVPDDRSCPELQEEDLAASATDGPMLMVYLARFSGDAAARTGPDGGVGVAGRLVSLRRLPLRSGAAPTSRLVGVHFAEFGPAVMARATLGLGDVAGGEATLDVVDVFVGAALDRRAGALVHHCVRVGDGAARVGALAVQLPSMAPLVWRAATGRPFTGCPAPADALETSMAEALAGDATLEVLEDRDVGAHGRVALVPRDDGAGLDVAVTLPPTHRSRHGRHDAGVVPSADAGAPNRPAHGGAGAGAGGRAPLRGGQGAVQLRGAPVRGAGVARRWGLWGLCGRSVAARSVAAAGPGGASCRGRRAGGDTGRPCPLSAAPGARDAVV